MPSITRQNGLDRVELLTAELRAIEHWDADYWRKARPEVYETLGYSARRERRAEILSQLRSLIHDLTRRADCGNNAAVNTLPRRVSARMSVYRNKTLIVARRSPVSVDSGGRVKERSGVTERRRHQRLELEVEVMVRTDRELLPGRTQEISEAGMSAILPVQLTEGDKVELQIKLPSATASTRAIVRDRNVFRHGFEFVQPLHGIVGNQALTGDCQTCAGAGSILRALAGEEGVAFAQLKCPECGGTRLKQA